MGCGSSVDKSYMVEAEWIQTSEDHLAACSQALTKSSATIQDKITPISTITDKIRTNKGYSMQKTRSAWREKDYIVNGALRGVIKCKNCAGVSHKGHGMCHFGCDVGANPQHCSVMNSAGFCTKCGCLWGDHINSPKYYYEAQETFYVTNDTMKAHFVKAHDELDNATKHLIFAIDEQLQKLDAFDFAEQTIQLCIGFLQQHSQDQAQLSRLKQMLGRQKTLKQAYEGKVKNKAFLSELKSKLEDEMLKPKEERDEGVWRRLDNIFGGDDAGN